MVTAVTEFGTKISYRVIDRQGPEKETQFVAF